MKKIFVVLAILASVTACKAVGPALAIGGFLGGQYFANEREKELHNKLNLLIPNNKPILQSISETVNENPKTVKYSGIFSALLSIGLCVFRIYKKSRG